MLLSCIQVLAASYPNLPEEMAYKVRKRRRTKRRISSDLEDFEFTNELLPPDKVDQ